MGTVGEPLKAIRQVCRPSSPKPPCSVSISTQSKPAPAMISAITGLATVSQAPQGVSPVLRRFFSLLLRSDIHVIPVMEKCGGLSHADVAQIGAGAFGDGQGLFEGCRKHVLLDNAEAPIVDIAQQVAEG